MYYWISLKWYCLFLLQELSHSYATKIQKKGGNKRIKILDFLRTTAVYSGLISSERFI